MVAIEDAPQTLRFGAGAAIRLNLGQEIRFRSGARERLQRSDVTPSCACHGRALPARRRSVAVMGRDRSAASAVFLGEQRMQDVILPLAVDL
jgi:hypothetical protein